MSHLYTPSLTTLHAHGQHALIGAIADADKAGTLCPPAEYIFKAFHLTPVQKTKVVILGQDPYQTPGKANGLAFGYRPEYKGRLDSSLKNIAKELYNDLGVELEDYSLERWAKQGVLLLNIRLTTETGKALAHKSLGWECELSYFLERLGDSVPQHVYLLVGEEAQTYKQFINKRYNLVIEAPEPSSQEFLGNKYFSRINKFLIDNQRGEIKW